MTDHKRQTLQQQWAMLHHSGQQSENHSLIIKLLAVVLCFAGLALALNPWLTAALLLILWLQDAIWKTFQHRTEQRLMAIEDAWLQIADQPEVLSVYRHWQDNRPGQARLIGQYLTSAIRPTIAYPYLLLLPINFVAAGL